MNYIERIEKLIEKVNKELLDIDVERRRGTPPTQVSSEFLTNKEQGDWAKATLLRGINDNSSEYIAVKYGRSDDIIAGEDGFKEFYNNYQDELDTIGKRPDLLLFKRADFPYKTESISEFSLDVLDELVPKAICGIEVRSSAFLMNKYESYMEERNQTLMSQAMALKENILNNYADLLRQKDEELYKLITYINEDNIHIISFRVPSWKASTELVELSKNMKELKEIILKINKRTFLSITPKVEDLKVVYNWIKRYGVPHYYVQVFFDTAYGISYEKILEMLGMPELEGKEYFIESDVKNQNKTTIKIKANKEANILNKIELPKHYSEMKELGRGRLLFYVKFNNSVSTINKKEFNELFGVNIG